MTKIIIPLIFVMLSLSTSAAFSQIYVGLGTGYAMPFGDFELLNKPSMTYHLNLENRFYCKLWYGVRVDYSQFEPNHNLADTVSYFEDMLNFTPNIRYNFLGQNCYEDAIFPYLQIGLPISSFGKTDDSPRLGIGLVAGGGFTYGFSLFNTCIMTDLNAAYNMPNMILRDDLRESIDFLHLNLTLNVKL